jgi:hypothetical protein
MLQLNGRRGPPRLRAEGVPDGRRYLDLRGSGSVFIAQAAPETGYLRLKLSPLPWAAGGLPTK